MSRTYPQTDGADPAAAERERNRQVTRELHEGAQDARSAARELRAERAAFSAGVVEETRAATQMALLAIDAHIAGQLAEMEEQLAAITELRESFLARLVELADTELDKEGMEKFMARSVLHAVRDREFIAAVVEAVAEEISGDHSLCAPADSARQVFVATPGALAAFRAGGGDPGYVIDMRT